MKKLLKISFLMIVLCVAVPVYAEGDMPTGSKPACTQNCGNGLSEETGGHPTGTDDANQDESTIEEIYSWLCKQISEFAG